MVDNPNDNIDRIGQTWVVQGYLVRSDRRFTPPTDIIEHDDRVVILVEIAGMRGDDFKLALHSQRLMISGVRYRPNTENAAYHQAEISFGSFLLAIPLPWSIIEERVSASYRDGFLRIELPRQQARRVRIVDVNTSES
jgi:HSP20 family protein